MGSISSLMRSEMAAAIAAGLAVGLVLLAVRPADRVNTRNALVLLGVCALAEMAENVMGPGRAAALVADAASVVIGFVLIRLGTIFVFRVVLRAVSAEPARIVEDLTTAGLYIGWSLLWLRWAGVELASLVATSAVVTAVLAFSMQETLGNVLGGVVLQLDRSLRVGDWVKVDQVGGRVVHIGWRHTAIETRDRETVIVPNGWLMKNRFHIVGSRASGGVWRRWIRVNVDLSAAPTEVCRVLEVAVAGAEIPNVASRAPDAVLMEFGPRHGAYALRYWIEDPARDDATDGQVRAHIFAALERHGMKLGVPYEEQLAIHDDSRHREGARTEELARRLAALEHVELFAALSDEERKALAGHLVHSPFVAGDVITRQGAVAHWLYLVISGEADVWREENGQRTCVATLRAGSVFGEMGLMTGEPRRATVTARTDVECYRLDKPGFEEILRARPDIAHAVSGVLATRDQELVHLVASNAAPASRPREDMLARIRRFFALDA